MDNKRPFQNRKSMHTEGEAEVGPPLLTCQVGSFSAFYRVIGAVRFHSLIRNSCCVNTNNVNVESQPQQSVPG